MYLREIIHYERGKLNIDWSFSESCNGQKDEQVIWTWDSGNAWERGNETGILVWLYENVCAYVSDVDHLDHRDVRRIWRSRLGYNLNLDVRKSLGQWEFVKKIDYLHVLEDLNQNVAAEMKFRIPPELETPIL